MPRTGGIYSLIASYLAVPNATIDVVQHNPVLEDIAQALTDSLPRDGSAAMTGNLPMAGKKITNLAAGTAASDAVRKDQVQPVDPTLTSIAALGTAPGRTIYTTGVDAWAETVLTTFGRSLIDDADAAAARATLGLGGNITASSTAVTDANTATDSGYWRTDGAAANIPEATIGVGHTANYNASGAFQMWCSLSSGRVYTRKLNVAWSAWVEVATSANMAALILAAFATVPYVSTEQTITSGGLLTLAHGLGAAPSMVAFQLSCQTAEAGYAVGDKPFAESGQTGGTASINTAYANATNVFVRFSNVAACFNVAHKTAGVPTVLTNANWKLIVRAYP